MHHPTDRITHTTAFVLYLNFRVVFENSEMLYLTSADISSGLNIANLNFTGDAKHAIYKKRNIYHILNRLIMNMMASL